MERNIRIARQLVKIARMLVSDDEKVLDEAVQKGESLPEDKKEEALDIVGEIVDGSGNPEAKKLLEQIVRNGSSCNGRRMVAFDLIEKIMKFSGDVKLVKALLVAAAMFGAVSAAEAKDIYFKSGDEIKALQVEDGKHDKTVKKQLMGIKDPDRKFANDLAEKVSSGKAGDVIIEEKDGVSYIAVRGEDGLDRMEAQEYFDSTVNRAIHSKYGNVKIHGLKKSGCAFGQNYVPKSLTYTFNTPGE